MSLYIIGVLLLVFLVSLLTERWTQRWFLHPVQPTPPKPQEEKPKPIILKAIILLFVVAFWIGVVIVHIEVIGLKDLMLVALGLAALGGLLAFSGKCEKAFAALRREEALRECAEGWRKEALFLREELKQAHRKELPRRSES